MKLLYYTLNCNIHTSKCLGTVFNLVRSVFWSCGCGMPSPQIDEFGLTHTFEVASEGEQGVGTRLRPAAPAFLNRFPTMCLQGIFATPDPTGGLRFRLSSLHIWSLLASQERVQTATFSGRWRCPSERR